MTRSRGGPETTAQDARIPTIRGEKQARTPFTAEEREAGRAKQDAKRARLVAERESSRLTYPDGSTIYKDSPPGRGWVLERPKEVKRYFELLASAIADQERRSEVPR